MKALILSLFLAASASAATFTVTQVTAMDCKGRGDTQPCIYKIQDGDTGLFTSWAAGGTTNINGVTVPGTIYGATADTNNYYNADTATWGSSGCNGAGNNIFWWQVNSFDLSIVGDWAGSFKQINCMASFGGAPGDRTWLPIQSGYQSTSTTSITMGTGTQTFTIASGKSYASGQVLTVFRTSDPSQILNGSVASYSGTTLVTTIGGTSGSGGTFSDWTIRVVGFCSASETDGCDWKPYGSACMDGACYLFVHRGERNDGQVHAFRAHDASLIKTTDGGVTWTNPAHVGGAANANGDAPAGPGDATYPASMLWPDPVSHNGVDQKMGQPVFIQYAQDGVAFPNVDNNGTYLYVPTFDGDAVNVYLARVVRANLANLSASDWSYYVCPGYGTAVCDGLDNANWSATMSNATSIGDVGSTFGFIGGVIYSSELHTYITTGFTAFHIMVVTAPHPWGPWTASGLMSRDPWSGAQLTFTAPILASVKTITAGTKIQFTAATTAYNGGAGSVASGYPSYVTYELTGPSATSPSTILGGVVKAGGTRVMK